MSLAVTVLVFVVAFLSFVVWTINDLATLSWRVERARLDANQLDRERARELARLRERIEKQERFLDKLQSDIITLKAASVPIRRLTSEEMAQALEGGR